MDKGQLKNLSDAEVDALYHMVRRERDKRNERRDDQGNHPIKDVSITLYIGGIALDATEHDLSTLFNAPVHIRKDRTTGKSLGYGYCIMNNVDEARQAKMLYDGYQFKGLALAVRL